MGFSIAQFISSIFAPRFAYLQHCKAIMFLKYILLYQHEMSLQPLLRLILHNAGHTLHVSAWTLCLGKFGLILHYKKMVQHC